MNYEPLLIPGPGPPAAMTHLHRIYYVPYTTTQRPFPFFIAVCVRAYTPHCPKICRGRRTFKVCLPPPLRGIGSATPALRTLPCNTTLFYEQALEIHAVGSSVPGQDCPQVARNPPWQDRCQVESRPKQGGRLTPFDELRQF